MGLASTGTCEAETRQYLYEALPESEWLLDVRPSNNCEPSIVDWQRDLHIFIKVQNIVSCLTLSEEVYVTASVSGFLLALWDKLCILNASTIKSSVIPAINLRPDVIAN